MSSEKVGFAGSSQGLLVGVLERPTMHRYKPRAVFAHRFTCGKNSLAATRISRALAQQGITTLRFDFTGLGESEGDFGRGGFSSSVADIVAAVHWMQSTIGMPALLVGHSLGDGGHRGGCPPRRHTGGLHAGRTRDGRPCASSLRSDQVRRGWADTEPFFLCKPTSYESIFILSRTHIQIQNLGSAASIDILELFPSNGHFPAVPSVSCLYFGIEILTPLTR